MKLSKMLASGIALIMCACSSGLQGSGSFVTAENASLSASPPPQGIDVTPATVSDCSTGGKVYTIYSDENQNNIREPEEAVISTQVVCNGQNGSNGTNGENGFSTLFSVNRVTTGLSACASGAGVQINSGLDSNRSSALDASEISNAQILCDGATGATGAPGDRGHGLVFKTVTATSALCPTGGKTLLLAVDVNDNGIYDTSSPGQQAVTLCNGHDAEVSAYTPVDAIMACGNTVSYKEVLLRLHSGQILGSFSNDTTGTMTRLSFLPDGSYLNTDTSNCAFSLSTSADGTNRSVSWFGQVQKTWSMIQ